MRPLEDRRRSVSSPLSDAAKARAAGDELEALGLCELAEQSLDVARDTLCRIESLG